MSNKKIGLLGGSFNPAHEGHVHISLEAIRLMGLDEVWWLVSPQNPIKATDDMSGFDERLQSAKSITADIPQIIISDFEKISGTNRTFDTLNSIKKSYHNTDFVWLMGADNLVIFDKWYNWEEIFHQIPIAVFARGELENAAKNSRAAQEFRQYEISMKNGGGLATITPPAWCFFDIMKNPASSTQIREKTYRKSPK